MSESNPLGANQVLKRVYQYLSNDLLSVINALRVYVVNSEEGGLINSNGFDTFSVNPTQIPLLAGVPTIILLANPDRLYAHVINNLDPVVYVQWDPALLATAALDQGFTLEKSGILTISGFELWKGQISAISEENTFIELTEAEQ